MRSNIIQELSALLRRLQLRNRFVAPPEGSNLSFLEAHIAIELSIHRRLRPSDLSRIIEVPRSAVTRALHSLEEGQYVQREKHARDSRSYELSLTKKGSEEIQRRDLVANNRLIGLLDSHAPEDIKRLSNFLDRFTLELGGEESASRSDEHHFRVYMRRLARTFGVLGTGFLGTKYSAVQFQVLAESLDGISLSDLAEKLNFNPSPLSLLIQKLERSKLLERNRIKSDKRRVQVNLTLRGKSELEEMRERLSQKVEKALAGFSDQECSEFLTLFRNLIEPKKSLPLVLQRRAEVEALDRNSASYQKMRERFVLLMIQNQQLKFVPHVILSPENSVHILKVDNTTAGILELRSKGGQVELVNFVSDKVLVSDELAEQFLATSLSKIGPKIEISELHVAAPYPFEALPQTAKTLLGSDSHSITNVA